MGIFKKGELKTAECEHVWAYINVPEVPLNEIADKLIDSWKCEKLPTEPKWKDGGFEVKRVRECLKCGKTDSYTI